MPAKTKRKDLLNAGQLRFVLAWKGNDTEAAREAGYSQPSKAATQLMSIPAVKAAIDRKQEYAIQISGKKVGKSLTKTEAIERALKLSDVDVKTTRGTIHGQVAALRLATELAGLIIKKTEDLTRQLEGKTEQEKEFFAANGYWPDAAKAGSGRPN